MALKPLTRVRRLCLALPESHEVEAWGEPTFRVRNRMFATWASGANHHGAGRESIWIKATPTEQDLRVQQAPSQFFVPPYVGKSGWVGVWMDGDVDWNDLGDLLEDAWRLTAPKTLVKQLDAE